MHKDPVVVQVLKAIERDPGAVESRMDYFYAEHFGNEGETDKQLAYLTKAIKKDPTDADVLIALYRLPDQTEARRKETRRLIDKAVGIFQAKVAIAAIKRVDPNSEIGIDLATRCNQFAWLVGNTVGEVDAGRGDEAIQASLRSVELRPDAAGYLDTLGRCYYARDDFVNAVKYQSEAARRDPHSRLIQRQLDLFQKALDTSKAKS
jgi:tetratricopeptide (TPR) repeat protein